MCGFVLARCEWFRCVHGGIQWKEMGVCVIQGKVMTMEERKDKRTTQ